MRETKDIVLMDEDLEGKPVELHFKLTQMSAIKQERWINRVVALFVSSNAKDMGSVQSILGSGKIESIMALFNGLKYEDIEPLYNELLECVQYIPDKDNPSYTQPMTAKNADTVITDVRNLYTLRFESLKINFSFFLNALQPPKEKATEEAPIIIHKPTRM